MRIHRSPVIPVPTLAAAIVVACSDGAPVTNTSPATLSAATAVIGTPVLLTSQLISIKCLDASRGNATTPAPTQLATCSGSTGQRFTWQADGSITAYGGAMCLDDSGAKGNDGDAIIIWPCKGSINQHWARNSLGEIVGINGKCIDITGDHTADGTPIILWTCHQGANQEWTLQPTTSTPPATAVTLTTVSGDNQVATYGSAVSAPLVVQARDVSGHAVRGATVAWTSTDGTVSSATTTTDSLGHAQIRFTVSQTFFTSSAIASIGASTVTFTATGNGTPSLEGRRPFPSSNPWNTDISTAPVDPNSAALIASCGGRRVLHPDFGTVWNGAPNGIPYIVVHGTQPKVPVSFTYSSESDPGPYPLPPNAPIEGGAASSGDRHVIVVDWDAWKTYELFNARPVNGGTSWTAGSGVIFDLTTGALRPAGWTSADAAGLPILPGLVRYDEVAQLRVIQHALRMSCDQTRSGYIAPAQHAAGMGTSANLPPMGMRVRLKASVDLSRFSPANQIILRALQHYGAFVADNGVGFMIAGAPDPRWSDSDLHTLQQITASDFEVVWMGAVTMVP